MPLVKLPPERLRHINQALLAALIILSAALLAFIAYDTINQIPFTDDTTYLHFQYWVCIAFIIIYLIPIPLTPKPLRYALTNIPFLLISLPWIDIIAATQLDLPAEVGYYLRYLPLMRGAWAAVLIAGYVSNVRVVSIFWSYLLFIIIAMSFASLIVFDVEGSVNPAIDSFGTALWWSSMQATTVGMPFDPVTTLGKIIAAILSAMGMMMFPLFTAYLTAIVRKHYAPKSPQSQK